MVYCVMFGGQTREQGERRRNGGWSRFNVMSNGLPYISMLSSINNSVIWVVFLIGYEGCTLFLIARVTF